ncbi:conserved membrane hypothetical protein [uncultured spirochete]|uniref:Integral membrane protein n=1 Tax=uncultured spirochete TaxID=156406 RepID=A0A3P3XV48_9SPIR|nr:conserved membrane hypothetical protein [uncultured spirochete]
MIGFLIKKSFFDGWDNLYLLAALNGVFLLVLLLFVVLPAALGAPTWLIIVLVAIAIVGLSIWDAAVTDAMYSLADAKSVHFSDIKAALSRSLKLGLIMGGLNLMIVVAVAVALPFYLGQKAMWGVFAGGVLFWTMLLAMLILQYVPAIFARDGGTPRQAFRTALYLFADNPGFSIFLLVWRVLTFAISILTMLLAPGPAGTSLASAVAVRLRMKKYRYLKENPEANHRQIPWDDLLLEEKELVGKRTLKGMIFPWKD